MSRSIPLPPADWSGREIIIERGTLVEIPPGWQVMPETKVRRRRSWLGRLWAFVVSVVGY